MSSQLQLCHVDPHSREGTPWVPEATWAPEVEDYQLYADITEDESICKNKEFELAEATLQSLLQENSAPIKSLPFPGTVEPSGLVQDVGLSFLDLESLYTTEDVCVDLVPLEILDLYKYLWYDTSAESQGLGPVNTKFSLMDAACLGPTSRDQEDDSVTHIVDLLTSGKVSTNTELQSQPGTLGTESQLSVFHGVLSWDSPFEIQTPKPNLEIQRQPPKHFRVRYEKETCNTPKGLLRNQERQPIAIKLSGLPLTTTNVTLQISTVTESGISHPTIHPSCFGKTMSPDWKENRAKRTVTTKFMVSETGELPLSYLAVRREKMVGMDLSRYLQNQLKFFRVKIKAFMALADGTATKIATVQTNVVHAVCPTKMSKIKKLNAEKKKAPTTASFA